MTKCKYKCNCLAVYLWLILNTTEKKLKFYDHGRLDLETSAEDKGPPCWHMYVLVLH